MYTCRHMKLVALLALVAVIGSAQANSIKGYVRQREDARSVRPSPVAAMERPGRIHAAPIPVQQSEDVPEQQLGKASPVAALESTKRLYQEEMSRRQQMAQVQQHSIAAAIAAARPVEEQKREKVVTTEVEPIARDGARVALDSVVPVQSSPEVIAPVAPVVALAPESQVAPVPVAPVAVPVAAPVVAPVAAPVEAPVVVPAAAPVEVPVVAPVATPVAAPVAPVVAPAVAPVALQVPVSPPVAAAPEIPVPAPLVAESPAKPAEPEAAPAAPLQEKKYKEEAELKMKSSAEPAPAPIAPVVQAEPSIKPVEALAAPVVAPVEAPKSVEVPVVQAAPAVASVVPVVESKSSAEYDDLLSAKKADQTSGIYAPIEVPAPDPGLVLSEPIDSTTKLLIDLDEHVQKFLPNDEGVAQPGSNNQVPVAGIDYAASPANPTGAVEQPAVAKPSIYSSSDAEPIVPPLPSLPSLVTGVEQAVAPSIAGSQASPIVPSVDSAASSSASSSSSSSSAVVSTASATRQGNQNQQQVLNQLIDQLDALYARIQDTNNQLIARRRYVMSALLRPMGTYVRRVRNNLDRLQNRVLALQNAAVSMGGSNNGQRPNGFVDAAAIDAIRRRIDDISKRISDIVNRIRFSLTPTSAPLNNGR